jgi:hypothetical protein
VNKPFKNKLEKGVGVQDSGNKSVFPMCRISGITNEPHRFSAFVWEYETGLLLGEVINQSVVIAAVCSCRGFDQHRQ